MTQVKTCFDCKMFDVANWVACLHGENDPRGTPSHEALSVSSQGALEISSVIGHPPSLDRNHFTTPRVMAKSHKGDERCRPSSQRPQYLTLYSASNEGWGAHLEEASTKGLWSDREKRLHINVLELKVVFYCVNTSYPMDKCYSGRRDRLAKRQKKTSCVSTGQPVLVLVHSPDGVSNPFPV